MLKVATPGVLVVTGLLGGLLSGHAVAQDPPPPPHRTAATPGALTENEKVAHVLNRFTMGANSELFAQVQTQGWREWLTAQLASGGTASAECAKRLEGFPSLRMSLAEIVEAYGRRPRADQKRQKGQKRAKGADGTDGEDAKPAQPARSIEARKAAQRRSNEPRKEVLVGAVVNAIYDELPVRQAAADFFRNHFSVDVAKGNLKLFIVPWERDIIQGMALGNFGDMLDATSRHPAMLFFLDNHLSRRPASEEEIARIRAWAKRRGKQEQAERKIEIFSQRGLNENYARELLELHTLGVDNFYTQEDIINVAKCLTGWTIARRTDERQGRTAASREGFKFLRAFHCEGDKPFLDGVIKAAPDDPESEGQAVLDALKEHPGTAKFLAWKLCRWFVNDTPDAAMVARVAKVFAGSNGDLSKVLLAIADDPAFFARRNLRAKFKRPWEFVVSALRVTGADVQNYRVVLGALKDMNEPLYNCPDPTGYYDQAEAWCDPGALAPRWAFAQELVSGRVRGVRMPAALFAGLPEKSPEAWVGILGERILPGGGLSQETRGRIEVLLAEGMQASGRARGGRGGRMGRTERAARVIVAALLGSPDFQKQ
jgi:uncharacterized protein (DUF1800 family)